MSFQFSCLVALGVTLQGVTSSLHLGVMRKKDESVPSCFTVLVGASGYRAIPALDRIQCRWKCMTV